MMNSDFSEAFDIQEFEVVIVYEKDKISED